MNGESSSLLNNIHVIDAIEIVVYSLFTWCSILRFVI